MLVCVINNMDVLVCVMDNMDVLVCVVDSNYKQVSLKVLQL